MSEITRLVASARLVTLAGPGGCGKTRLALRVAPRLSEQFRREVTWVELSSIADASLIPQSIARALNVADAPEGSLLDAVTSFLRPRDLLLILDNGEHVVGPLAEVAEHLLLNCPGLYLLVTSREALNIHGETSWNVPPLTLPAGVDDELGKPSEAVQLFVDRARSADPSFELTPANVADVATICHSLDGMPLAIELAASRVRVLGVREIADRLGQSFRMLTAGRRTALPRHQTLQATIDWSYALLSLDERRLFARLSVFAGGFTLDAVEAVCAGDCLDPADILELLAHLTSKSLVVVDHLDTMTRYRLLQTIHQYSEEKLNETGTQAMYRTRHSRWCAQLAESGSELEAAGQAELVERFEAEHDNLRAAMQWAIETDESEALGRIAGSLWRFWLIRGYLREGANWLREAADRLPEHSPMRASCLFGAAVLTSHQADYSQSRELFNASLAIYHSIGDRNGEGDVLNGLAEVAQFQGHYEEAASYFERNLSLFDHPRVRALSLMGLTLTLLYLGQIDRAAEMCEESLALCRQIDDDRSTAGALTNLGIINLAQGNVDRAEYVCRQSLDMRRAVGDRGGVAHTMTVLGTIALKRADIDAATDYFREALSLREETGNAGAIAGPLEGLAAIDVLQGEPMRGVHTFAAAESLRSRYETPPSPIEQAFRDRYLDIARERVNDVAFRRSLNDGRSADPEAVVATALTSATSSRRAKPPAPDTLSPVVVAADRDREIVLDLDISAFGPSRVVRNGHEIEASEWTYAKSRELLLFLLGVGASTKEQIGVALWPDASDTQLRSSFHSTLHHLRRALGDSAWVVYRNGVYAFNRSRPFSYDVGSFEQEISRARGLASHDRPRAIELLSQAVERYHGKYLADLADSDWHLSKQEQLEREYLDALLLLGDLLIAESAPTRAAETYRMAIAADEFLETAHRGLMRCYELQGERGLALRHYQSLADMLRDELGADPDPKTRELFERLLLERDPGKSL